MRTFLRNAAVWTGIAGEPVQKMDVLLEGDLILAVQPSGTFKEPEGTTVVDLGGAYIVPGLIDMHVHLVWSGSANPVRVVDEDGEQLTAIRAVANGLTELHHGVTTVRDLGGNWDIPLSVARSIERGHTLGPNVIACGKTVIMTGGHDPFWGNAADGSVAVLAAVRRQISLGATVIKVAATGGVYGRPEGEAIGQSELSFEELQVAVSEAHRFGVKVAAHALGRDGIFNAVRAGVDTIEHGTFLDESCLELMKLNGTVVCPTLFVYRTIADGETHAIPPYAVDKAKKAITAHRDSFRAALKAGIPIVAGSDAGSPNTPHGALIDELLLMHEYGMSAERVLDAATATAAEVLGLASRIGTIEAGKQADLLVLERNPLDDLNHLREVRMVFSRGHAVYPPRPVRRDVDHGGRPPAEHSREVSA